MKLLPNLFNWVQNLVETFTFYGGGSSGGGSSAPQQTTSYSTNLPEYAKPYYEELLRQSGRNVFDTSGGSVTGVKAYTPYTGERVAGFTPQQLAVQEQAANLRQPGQFGAATAGLGAGQQMAFGAAGTGLGQAFAYNPNNVPVFGQGAASYYMNPYQQNVTDIALREARQQGDIQRQQQALGAIGRGTFGGARNTLMQAEQARNLNKTLGDIQAQGSQQAYLNAQQQFNADVARQQQAQQFGAGLGQQIGLAGLQSGIQGSTAMGALGATQQTADLERLKAQAASAGEQQALQQKIDDIKYQQAMEQRDWAQKQLEFYSNILRGNVGALGSTQVQYAPPSSPLAGLGTGLQALSLAKSLT